VTPPPRGAPSHASERPRGGRDYTVPASDRTDLNEF